MGTHRQRFVILSQQDLRDAEKWGKEAMTGLGDNTTTRRFGDLLD